MNPILGGGGLHHVCLKTRDWDATMRFYQETLGCTVKVAWRDAPARAVMLDAGERIFAEEQFIAEGVHFLALLIHHIVVFERVFADRVVALFDAFLCCFDRSVEDFSGNSFSFWRTETL